MGIKQQKEKSKINIVVLGHVDSREATSSTKLMYKAHSNNKSIEKIEKKLNDLRESSFMSVWLMNALNEEELEQKVNMMNIRDDVISMIGPPNTYTRRGIFDASSRSYSCWMAT